jgi:small subunit ribosomal protein S21
VTAVRASASNNARLRLSRIFPHSNPRNDLTTVIPKPDEPVEVALRRFRRSIQNIGLIAELRARTAYEKPTTERKRKKAAAVARLRKQIRRSLPPRKSY